MSTSRLEASVVYSICNQLENLGWTVDERDPSNNVTQQRTKTVAERDRLIAANGRPAFPDFTLYERGTTRPIAIIEAKRPGGSLSKALDQAEHRYARPLGAPLIFAYNDTFVATRYLFNERPLKIDGEDVRQFVDHYTSLRFVNEGPEILSAPEHVQLSREELIRIFKRQADLLREAGLQAGLERFGAFSDVLFLKLMDEVAQLQEHAGQEATLPPHVRWSEFQDKAPDARLQYVHEVVWPTMNAHYGEIFSHAFPIRSAEIFDDMVKELTRLNFTGTDVDVKGDAFEYFLKNAYLGIKIKDLGEYFTARNIVRTMVSMVDPKIGEKIYDPFCGTGGFLIEAFRYISLRTKLTDETARILKEQTIYGSELTVTARVARMNMILYGDGHNNVMQRDSFATPRHEEFDVILTNPPFSQATRHGNLYRIPARNGDVIAIQHCLDALAPNGRAALLVKEDFLTKGGTVGQTRKMLLDSAKNFSVVSLPRRLFEPYTPTKTSIIYFEKAGKRSDLFFFVVRNVGHTFGARKVSRPENDLPDVLSTFNTEDVAELPTHHAVIADDLVRETDHSLWIYDYIDAEDGDIVDTPLGDLIVPSGKPVTPSESPEDEYRILGVTNSAGVYLNEELLGGQMKGPRIQVDAGDLVYNPHRVNVGSIGFVPPELAGGLVSAAYVVFRPADPSVLPPQYIVRLLKSPTYQEVIKSYDTKHGAVRANLNWEQLCRIKIPAQQARRLPAFRDLLGQYTELRGEIEQIERRMTEVVEPRQRMLKGE